MAPDGDGFRRVVASPLPQRIFQIRPVKWLLEKGCIVICAGGGGIPTMYAPGRRLQGIDAVVDKDRASSLMARELEVDLFIMATDADAVYLDWGKPTQRAIRRASPEALAAYPFAGRLDGPQGRGGDRVRRAHRQDRRHRRPGRRHPHRPRRGGDDRDPGARPGSSSTRPELILGVFLEARRAAPGWSGVQEGGSLAGKLSSEASSTGSVGSGSGLGRISGMAGIIWSPHVESPPCL